MHLFLALLLTFAWDAGGDYPAGTTYELEANGVTAAGIEATQQTLDVPGAPGDPLDVRVRAVAPDGRLSGWAALNTVIPGGSEPTVPLAAMEAAIMPLIYRDTPWTIQPPLGVARMDRAHPINAGALVWWLINEGAGTTLYDLVDTKNGTITGIDASAWTTGALGYALKFDGTNDYAQIALGEILPAFTVSLWYRNAAAPAGGTIDQPFSWNASGDQGVAFSWNHGTTGFRQAWSVFDGSYRPLKYTTTLQANTLYNLVLTYDGTTYRTYLNGAPDVTGVHGQATATGSETTQMGAGRGGTDNFDDGTYFGFRMWDRALTAGEVRALYDSQGLLGLMPQRRYVFFPAAVGGVNEVTSTDGLLIPDRPLRLEEHTIRQGVFINDQITRTLEGAQREGVFLKDQFIKDQQHIQKGGLFLDDTAKPQLLKLRTQTDGLLLLDEFSKTQEAIAQENLLFNDYPLRLQEILQQEQFLLDDQSYLLREKTLIDGCLLRDDVTAAKLICTESGGGSERLAPDAVITQTDLTGSLTDIQDDPDSPDANWMLADSTAVNPVLRTSFGSPTANLRTGVNQEFRVLIRRNGSGSGQPDWTVGLRITGGGADLAQATGTIAVEQEVVALTWDKADHPTVNTDGSNVECHITGVSHGGGPNQRSIDIGAVEWNAETTSGGLSCVTEITKSNGVFLLDTWDPVLVTGDPNDIVITDTLLLLDNVSRTTEKGLRDTIFLPDQDSDLQEATQRDGVLLKDLIARIQASIVADGLFVSDNRLSDLSKTAREGLFVADQSVLDQEKQLRDSLLLLDQTLTSIEFGRLLLDGLLLLDLSERTQEKVLRDHLFLLDTVATETSGIQIVERTVTDQLLLTDRRTGEQLRQFSNGLFLTDEAVRVVEPFIVDRILVPDTVKDQATRTRLLVDGVFLADQVERIQEKILRDTLFLFDSVLTEVEFGTGLTDLTIRDGLLLDDRRTSLVEALHQDGLLIGEFVSRLRELIRVDALLVADAVASGIERTRRVSDPLLVSDQFARLEEKILFDPVLLLDKVEKTAELYRRNGLLISDSAVTLLVEALAEALVFAKLGFKDPLGITTNYQDPLGLKTGWHVESN